MPVRAFGGSQRRGIAEITVPTGVITAGGTAGTASMLLLDDALVAAAVTGLVVLHSRPAAVLYSRS